MFKVIALFVTLIVACAGEFVHPKASASIKNTHFNGLDGLNLHLTVPYKYQDYVVGVKHTVGNDLKKLPDAVFAKKSFNTPLDGSVAVDAHFSVADKTLHVDSEWSSAKHGVTALVRADSRDYLTKVKLTKTQALPNDLKLTVCSGYNVLKNVFCGDVSVKNDATTVRLTADSEAQDPKLSVSHHIDEHNEVSPSISLRTGAMSYGFTRRWLGGSAKAHLVLNDKVTVEWQDNGANGVWTTTASVPLNGDKPSISFAREWIY